MRAGKKKTKKKKTLETDHVLTQNTQADLTHNLFNVHLPPLVRIVDLSKPTHHLQCHLASDLVLKFERSGQFYDGGCVVRLGERDEVHQEELEDLVEVRRGERAQGTLWAWAWAFEWAQYTPTRQLCLGHCEKAGEGEFTIYGKYMLVLECLRYLLLASLELYLSIFKSKPFPLRLGK
jgi:hypothetical protein